MVNFNQTQYTFENTLYGDRNYSSRSQKKTYVQNL